MPNVLTGSILAAGIFIAWLAILAIGIVLTIMSLIKGAR